MTAKLFQQRFLPMQPQLYRIALAILGVVADAEDAVQETYLRVWQQADKIDGMENVEGFFVLTLRNVCLNMIRSRKGTVNLDTMNHEMEEDEEMQSLILKEDLMLLRKVISLLQPKARSMVTMFYISQMGSRQIAEIMGETDANVRSILSRARAQIREILLKHKEYKQ